MAEHEPEKPVEMSSQSSHKHEEPATCSASEHEPPATCYASEPPRKGEGDGQFDDLPVRDPSHRESDDSSLIELETSKTLPETPVVESTIPSVCNQEDDTVVDNRSSQESSDVNLRVSNSHKTNDIRETKSLNNAGNTENNQCEPEQPLSCVITSECVVNSECTVDEHRSNSCSSNTDGIDSDLLNKSEPDLSQQSKPEAIAMTCETAIAQENPDNALPTDHAGFESQIEQDLPSANELEVPGDSEILPSKMPSESTENNYSSVVGKSTITDASKEVDAPGENSDIQPDIEQRFDNIPDEELSAKAENTHVSETNTRLSKAERKGKVKKEKKSKTSKSKKSKDEQEKTTSPNGDVSTNSKQKSKQLQTSQPVSELTSTPATDSEHNGDRQETAEEEDSWDTLFDDTGECLDDTLLQEVRL